MYVRVCRHRVEQRASWWKKKSHTHKKKCLAECKTKRIDALAMERRISFILAAEPPNNERERTKKIIESKKQRCTESATKTAFAFNYIIYDFCVLPLPFSTCVDFGSLFLLVVFFLSWRHRLHCSALRTNARMCSFTRRASNVLKLYYFIVSAECVDGSTIAIERFGLDCYWPKRTWTHIFSLNST